MARGYPCLGRASIVAKVESAVGESGRAVGRSRLVLQDEIDRFALFLGLKSDHDAALIDPYDLVLVIIDEPLMDPHRAAIEGCGHLAGVLDDDRSDLAR